MTHEDQKLVREALRIVDQSRHALSEAADALKVICLKEHDRWVAQQKIGAKKLRVPRQRKPSHE